ncbi:hypothetical protein [Arenimonas metalli]|uniref:Uncharacterized protein n=1 Tax=Arenimonas metalli CF5-1 TaxID=1384056 RepID=A0A091B1T5_9GAMM|nr:hypothetical protein [Arenimonas metalli]KFN46558.1 hypothetical protein N787_10030 [Arenimonas metalli CF5-1]
MQFNRGWVVGWLLLAGTGVWLQLGGPARVLGADAGSLGFALVALAAIAALVALRTLPASKLDEAISPAEGRAWGNLLVSTVILACVVVESGELLGVLRAGELERIVGRSYLLVIAIGGIGWAIDRRWKQRIQSDERDRDIQARAVAWGRSALALLVFTVLAMLAGSPAEHLAWASHEAIAHLLLYAILLGFITEFGYSVVRYALDRRA